MDPLATLLDEIAGCRICADSLPLGPGPVVQLGASAKILIAGQAPGRRVHESRKPFDDPSGVRLRSWMGVDEETFYDPNQVAILPMGFCFPGTGKSGDLPPRSECEPAWRERALATLEQLQLTVVLGQYALAYHLPGKKTSVTDAVRNWQTYWPTMIPLPHPSPRNQGWFARNPWFETDVVPRLQERVQALIG